MAWLTDEVKRLQLAGARKKPVVEATRAPPDPTSIDGHSLHQLAELLREKLQEDPPSVQHVAGRGQKEGRGLAGPDTGRESDRDRDDPRYRGRGWGQSRNVRKNPWKSQCSI